MVSATDLITYIGVPLAVAGVMPLLWNMFVAIHIRIKLGRSIPPNLRKYYTLIADPTAGKVTVVAHMPTLDIPGLWSTNPSKARPAKPPSEKRGPHSQFHASLLAMSIPLTAPSTAIMAQDATSNNLRTSPSPPRIARPKLLGRTWISLVERHGMTLKRLHHGESGDEDDLGDEEAARFIVESDLKTDYRTPLKMKWPQLVWLSLALGISAYDPNWQSGYPYTLKSSGDEDLVHLSREEDRIFAKFVRRGEPTYALRRAFAWYNIKLDGDRLFLLGHSKSAPLRLSSLTISPELSACRLGMSLDPQECSNIVRGKEPQDCNNALAAACSWMLYWRRQCLDFDEPPPISQHLLEYRERALCYLGSMDGGDGLLERVQSIVLAKTLDEFTTQYGASSGAVLPTARASMAAARLLAYSSSAANEALENKQVVEDVPLSVQTQVQVEDILRPLRSTFASSRYVRRHYSLCCHTVEDATTWIEGQKSGDHKTTMIGEPQEMLQRWQWAMDTLGTELSSRDHFDWRMRSSVGGGSKRVSYDLLPAHLRAELEHAVQSRELDPDGHSVTRWNEVDGIGFIACLALALADWDHHPVETWTLRPDFRYMASYVGEVLGMSSKGYQHKKIGDLDHLESSIRDMETDILGKGLYTAPSESPVSSLLQLRGKDSIVYLL